MPHPSRFRRNRIWIAIALVLFIAAIGFHGPIPMAAFFW